MSLRREFAIFDPYRDYSNLRSLSNARELLGSLRTISERKFRRRLFKSSKTRETRHLYVEVAHYSETFLKALTLRS